MKFKSINRLLIGSVLSLSCLVSSAQAGLITIGALTSNNDGSTSVITDTLNNLEWMRWNESANFNYAEALLQNTSGWTIAGANQANLFLNALYNGISHGCSDNIQDSLFCADSGSFSSEEYTALLGDSSTRGTSSIDAAWFYDDEITDGKAGFLNLTSGTSNQKYNTYGTIATTEEHRLLSNGTIGWLMYRTATVPEPTTLTIFALGIIALALRRFKKQVSPQV
ncbi:PEP-CTERM sorting domain-containing protein [Cognaticolwellia beringensis]|uniref:PEP-CTERM sorting domain-containing protein n=1 Tax=Cognaticolwellia beringensis TaxID=1967665 RepID=A0A222G965_9GAMM|nr:PEP-CTERM sorting domain-containing protein [Cognaticolwellia beringensis]ASP48445.1 PEP-CTERM sorting domain-containing protein [Cognaticolwellia beringensis]